MGIEYKISGVIQLVAISVVILYLLTNVVPKSYVLISIAFFALKGIAFTIMKHNPLSVLDTIAGIYLFFPVMGWFSNTIMNIIFIGFLAQKGIVYLFR